MQVTKDELVQEIILSERPLRRFICCGKCTPFRILNTYPPSSAQINVLTEELGPEDGHKTFLEKDVNYLPVRGRRNIPKYFNLLGELFC
jgi:hypothetical protein